MAKGLFKIYVGNLDYKVTEFAVRRLFESHGDIEDIAMATDKETGKPRGFAIVMMRDHDQARTAIDSVQGRRLMGRALVVNEAIAKKNKSAPPAASGAGPTSERGGAASSSRASSSATRSYRSSDSDAPRAGGRNPRRAGGRNPRRGSAR
jgi:RNA recognition motif-containing protein